MISPILTFDTDSPLEFFFGATDGSLTIAGNLFGVQGVNAGAPGTQGNLRIQGPSTQRLTLQFSGSTADRTVNFTDLSGDVLVAPLAQAFHFGGKGSAPSIAAGAGAGTSPTISITGTDAAGVIQITPGASPSSNAVVATITFASAYAVAPVVVLYPRTANTANSNGSIRMYTTSTTTTFDMAVAISALTASVPVEWGYLVIQPS